MKIERINENQIRCTLTSLDLSSRNINLVELAYGTEKARKLFREMIQQASSEVGFDAEDIPLMVEAIPLSSESIMLVITKIEDPEELDTRFSKFSPFGEEGKEDFLSPATSEFLEGAQSQADKLTSPAAKDPQDISSEEKAKNTKIAVNNLRIFRFDNLDRICEASRAIRGIYSGLNTLYKKPGTRQYYLVLKRIDCDDLDFSRVCNILAEYAVKQPNEYASEAYLNEHYEIMIQKQALQNLQKI